MIHPPQSDRRLTVLYLCVMAGALLVGAWARKIDPVINPDGVKYILASINFLRGEFQLGLEAHKWPFYSMAISAFSLLIQQPAEISAIILNALLRGIGGIAFIRICRNLGADYRQSVLAALVYLCYPGLNEVQSMVIRDIAYVTCFLWMVVFFMQMFSRNRRRDIAGFIICAVLATLFRIEGVVFLVGLGMVYLRWGSVSRRVRRLLFYLAFMLLPLLAWGVLNWIYDGEAGNAWQIIQDTQAIISQQIDEYIRSLENGLWKSLLQTLSPILLGLFPLGRLTVNILEIVSIGYLLLLVTGFFLRPLLDDRPDTQLGLAAIRWIASINIVILLAYVLIRQIVTDRYPLTLALLLMVFLPFIITRAWDALARRRRWARNAIVGFASLLFLVNTVEGLDRFTSKSHLIEAGAWLREQNPGREDVYINDRVVDYYAGQLKPREDDYYSAHVVNTLVLTSRWKRLDFLVIRLARYNRPGFIRSLRNRIGKEPDRVFDNGRGDRVFVYDFRHRKA